MGRKACLDTSFLIELVKGNPQTRLDIQKIEAEYALSTVTIFEMWAGKKTEENLLAAISEFTLLDFNFESAKLAGTIYKELRKRGVSLDMRDVFIAAICIKNNFELLTINKKHFQRIGEFGLVLAN